MKKRLCVLLTLLCVISCLMLTASCSKKKVKLAESVITEEPYARQRTDTYDKAKQDELARQRALEEERLRREREAREREASFRTSPPAGDVQWFENEDVYFAYDSAALSPMAQDVLRRKADFLNQNTGVSVNIEGHCDERGTNEYNLALGDRRARGVRDFLINLGVSPSRMNPISYGEERPLDPDSTENAWAKNRRAHFVIK